MNKDNRRDFLKKSTAVAVGAAAMNFTPDGISEEPQSKEGVFIATLYRIMNEDPSLNAGMDVLSGKLKRPVDKDNAPSLSRAESKKLVSEENRSFATLAHHLHLVATIYWRPR
jgi:hypothetical protein